MKRSFFIIIFLAAVGITLGETQLQLPDNYSDTYAGTEINPFVINNLGNLRWLSETESIWGTETESYYFEQTNDIDASDTHTWNDGAGFNAIGYHLVLADTTIDNSFRGGYNGNNHAIDGIYINTDEVTDMGFFGSVKGSRIENISLTNINLIDATMGGGLAVYCLDSVVKNCSVEGDITSSSNTVSGLINQSFDSTIENCFTKVNISGDIAILGVSDLIGVISNSTVINCYSINNIDIQMQSVFEGFIAVSWSSVIENCYTASNVRAVNQISLCSTLRNTAVSDYYWNTDSLNTNSMFNVNNESSLINVQGLSSEEMQNPAMYTYYNWDFDIWGMNPEVNNGFPFLLWEGYETTSNEVDLTLNSLTAINYPNPFNPETTIQFNNPKAGQVSVDIYNIKGQLVKTLINSNMNQGIQKVVWNGTNNSNKKSASGIYFYKIKSGNTTAMKKIILMK